MKSRERFPWARFKKHHGVKSDWPMSSAASFCVGAVKSTLLVWSKEGCPLLGGRRLRSKLFHVYGNRFVRCYSKSDLDEILEAKAKLPAPTAFQNPEWGTRRHTGMTE
jgi:hypothetical protein